MSEEREELLPCPFCGGDAFGYRSAAEVECSTCHASVPGQEITAAIAAWNRRSPGAQQEPQWLPIDSAPKDGTRIIARSGGNVFIVYWSHGGWRFEQTGLPARARWSAWLPSPPVSEE